MVYSLRSTVYTRGAVLTVYNRLRYNLERKYRWILNLRMKLPNLAHFHDRPCSLGLTICEGTWGNKMSGPSGPGTDKLQGRGSWRYSLSPPKSVGRGTVFACIQPVTEDMTPKWRQKLDNTSIHLLSKLQVRSSFHKKVDADFRKQTFLGYCITGFEIGELSLWRIPLSHLNIASENGFLSFDWFQAP